MLQSVSQVRDPGPWTHEDVNAGGISFHVATSGDGPHTALLLHDFPLYWWSWRQQLPVLADAGYRAVAADLRGFGGTDFQPGDVSLSRLRADIASLLRGLGTESATVVGAGMGGVIGWSLAHDPPPGVESLVVVNAPHPLSGGRNQAPRGTFQPPRSQRRQVRGLQQGRLERALLENLAAPANSEVTASLASTYSMPLRRRFAAKAAVATYSATHRIRPRDRKLFEMPVNIPTLSVRGGLDPVSPPTAYAGDLEHVSARYVHDVIPPAGHWVSDESPEQLSGLLLDHLAGLGL